MFLGRYRDLGSLQGIVFGIFLASVSYLLLFWILDLASEENVHDYVIAFLITSATILSAFFALRGNRAQMLSADLHQREIRERSLRAAVAMLPLALSKFSIVCMNNMKRHFDSKDLVLGGAQITELLAIDQESAAILRECVQFSDDTTSKKIQNLVRTYQVLVARAEDLKLGKHIAPGSVDQIADHDLVSDVINWATLHALVDHIFPFSRGEVDAVPKQWDHSRVESVMRIAGIYFEDFPNIGKVYKVRLDGKRLAMFDD